MELSSPHPRAGRCILPRGSSALQACVSPASVHVGYIHPCRQNSRAQNGKNKMFSAPGLESQSPHPCPPVHPQALAFPSCATEALVIFLVTCYSICLEPRPPALQAVSTFLKQGLKASHLHKWPPRQLSWASQFFSQNRSTTNIYTEGPCLPSFSPLSGCYTVGTGYMLTVQTQGSHYLAVTFQDLVSRPVQGSGGQGAADGDLPGCRARGHGRGTELHMRTGTLIPEAEMQDEVAPAPADLRLHLQRGALRATPFPARPPGGASRPASPTSLLMKQ